MLWQVIYQGNNQVEKTTLMIQETQPNTGVKPLKRQGNGIQGLQPARIAGRGFHCKERESKVLGGREIAKLIKLVMRLHGLSFENRVDMT